MLRRVSSSESRAGGPADRESDESGALAGAVARGRTCSVPMLRRGERTHAVDHSAGAASEGW